MDNSDNKLSYHVFLQFLTHYMLPKHIFLDSANASVLGACSLWMLMDWLPQCTSPWESLTLWLEKTVDGGGKLRKPLRKESRAQAQRKEQKGPTTEQIVN